MIITITVNMIKKFTMLVICVAVMLIALASAEDITGSWAYIHAPEEAAFILNPDGSAQLDGKAYQYTLDGDRIVLTNKKGDVSRLRYVWDGDNILLYKTAVYIYEGKGQPAGLIGIWKDATDKWSYQFTEKGTFLEDGYFPGYYTVDEAGKSFKLVYVDQFADTICYYEIDGDRLTVEYPWPMVRTK